MLGSLIIETVDFEASHSEDRVVIAAGVSNKVDHLRDKFENLDDTLVSKIISLYMHTTRSIRQSILIVDFKCLYG